MMLHSLAVFFLLLFAVSSEKLCVEVGDEEFRCTSKEDILSTRLSVDGKSIDVGVSQRVDGSESEKKAIREVLDKMDTYFFNEVLAMPEYKYVRDVW